MPNWCSNSIKVYGSPEDRYNFRKRLRKEDHNVYSAIRRALAMIVSEVVEPTMIEIHKAHLLKMVQNNEPLNEANMRVLSSIWSNFDKSVFEKNAEELDQVWRDGGFHRDHIPYDNKDKSFSSFLKRVDPEEQEGGLVETLDFCVFVPTALCSGLLGFNSFTEPLIHQFAGKITEINHINFNRQNWGTKWNAVDPHIMEDEDCIEIRFCTAWSPAGAVYEKIAKQHPELSFDITFEESGMAFCGREVWKNGEMSAALDGDMSFEEIGEDGYRTVMPDWFYTDIQDFLRGA